MSEENLIVRVEIEPPYLVFVGDTEDEVNAKTALGIVHWRRELCMGQHRLTESTVDLGLPDLKPGDAAVVGARTLVVGVANIGGFFPETWIEALTEAVDAGLDIVAGMHTRLSDLPGMSVAAEKSGARLIDVRVPPANLPIGTGKRRVGRRLLTVGTDCVSGKKYTALALEREMLARGMRASFRATGQTGIMIAGCGIPIDAVVADFVAGAAELLSPDNEPDHWDVIEGQGAIHHPAYAGVTLGLLHGSQPDAIVVCHDAARETIDGWDGFPVSSVADTMKTTLRLGRLTNPDIRGVGVSVNTSKLPAEGRAKYLHDLSSQLGLPCVDPVIDGVGPIVDVVIEGGEGCRSS